MTDYGLEGGVYRGDFGRGEEGGWGDVETGAVEGFGRGFDGRRAGRR